MLWQSTRYMESTSTPLFNELCEATSLFTEAMLLAGEKLILFHVGHEPFSDNYLKYFNGVRGDGYRSVI